MLVAVERAGGAQLHAFALEAGSEPTLRFEVDAGDEYGLYALLYTETLEQLGFAPGEVELVADPPLKPLEPAAQEVLAAQDSAGHPTVWDRADVRPAWVQALRTRGEPSPCVRFTVQSLDVLPAPEVRNTWAFAATSGALVTAATRGGELFQIGMDGRAERVDAPQGALYASAGAVDETGHIWVADELGQLWRGEVAKKPEEWTIASRWTPLGQVEFMDVAPDGSEVVLQARSGAVAVYSPRQDLWRGPWDAMRASMQGNGGVVWLEADTFLVVGPFSRSAARVQGGQLVEEEPLPGAKAGITSIHRVPGVGIVAGTGEGELFRRDGGRWLAMPDSGSRLWVMGMAPYGPGMVFGSPYGSFGQYPGTDVACPVTTPVSFFVRFIAPLGDRLVLLGESLAPPAPSGAVLTPIAR